MLARYQGHGVTVVAANALVADHALPRPPTISNRHQISADDPIEAHEQAKQAALTSQGEQLAVVSQAQAHGWPCARASTLCRWQTCTNCTRIPSPWQWCRSWDHPRAMPRTHRRNSVTMRSVNASPAFSIRSIFRSNRTRAGSRRVLEGLSPTSASLTSTPPRSAARSAGAGRRPGVKAAATRLSSPPGSASSRAATTWLRHSGSSVDRHERRGSVGVCRRGVGFRPRLESLLTHCKPTLLNGAAEEGLLVPGAEAAAGWIGPIEQRRRLTRPAAGIPEFGSELTPSWPHELTPRRCRGILIFGACPGSLGLAQYLGVQDARPPRPS